MNSPAASSRERPIVRVLVAVMAIVPVTLGVVGLVWLQGEPFDNESFQSAEWLGRTRPQERATMARDLVNRHLVAGMSSAQVVAMLGPPTEIMPHRDGPGEASRVAQTYTYWIGSWCFDGYDDAFVYVRLDGSGHVLSSEITGY